MTSAKLIEAIEQIADRRELERVVKAATAALEQKRVADLPMAVIVGDVRPRYLKGCKGRVGGYVSARRREFFPQPGTAAHARGTVWRVDSTCLRMEV